MPNSFTGIGGWNVVDSEMRSISGNFATTTALNNLAEVVANFGSYTTANGTGADNHPDVTEPSMKTIYLVKDSSITTGDAYKEWICTNTTTPTYELIGDTQVDLSNYYLKTQTSSDQEIADALSLKEDKVFIAEYNVTPYADIKAAYDAGKQIICKYAPLPQFPDQVIIAYLTQYVPMGNCFVFAANNYSNQFQIIECSNVQWSVGNHVYYTKSETSGKQEIQDALDLKQNIWSSAAISTLTTSYDIANNTVTKLENNNISDILEFNITGLSSDEVPNVSIEFINNQADCYPVFKNNNVELLCNTDTCYSGKSYMFRALGSMSEIVEMRQSQPNVSVNGTVVSVNGNLITP